MSEKLYDLPNGQQMRGEDAWLAVKGMIEKDDPRWLPRLDIMLSMPAAAENLGKRLAASFGCTDPLAGAIFLIALTHRSELLQKANP